MSTRCHAAGQAGHGGERVISGCGVLPVPFIWGSRVAFVISMQLACRDAACTYAHGRLRACALPRKSKTAPLAPVVPVYVAGRLAEAARTGKPIGIGFALPTFIMPSTPFIHPFHFISDSASRLSCPTKRKITRFRLFHSMWNFHCDPEKVQIKETQVVCRIIPIIKHYVTSKKKRLGACLAAPRKRITESKSRRAR